MAESKAKAQRRPAAPKQLESVVGGENSPYRVKRDGDMLFCLYGDSVTASYDKRQSLEDADASDWRWTGPLRREFAIAVSSALMARNMQGNLVYTVPAGESVADGISVGILVGLSFGGSMVETTATVSFDKGALDGDDALEVARNNCAIAARNLVDGVIASRLRP